MKQLDYRNTMVRIKHLIKTDGSLILHITGLVLPQFERKDPLIPRSFQCIAHEKDVDAGQYVLHLLLTDPEPTDIMVSTWYEDYKKILQT